MAPEHYRSADNEELEDLQLLVSHLDAMKLMDRASLDSPIPAPTPDRVISSNADVFGWNSNRNITDMNMNMNDNGSGVGNNNDNNNNNNIYNEYKPYENSIHNDHHNHNNDNNITNNNNNNNNRDERNIGTKILNQVSALFKNPPLVDVGSLINKEMLKYDIKERNAIYEEVHGVGSICPDESQPGMVETALDNLMQEIEAMPINKKSAYQESLKFPYSYVHTNDFRLRFLRAALFDPKKAAVRMTCMLDFFSEVFGPYILERPVRLSDFSKKELKIMNSGRIQLLPYRDRGGRRVVVGVPSQEHNRYDPLTRVSVLFYDLFMYFIGVEYTCCIVENEYDILFACRMTNRSIVYVLDMCCARDC